mgnify:CR=1 FL=1
MDIEGIRISLDRAENGAKIITLKDLVTGEIVVEADSFEKLFDRLWRYFGRYEQIKKKKIRIMVKRMKTISKEMG